MLRAREEAHAGRGHEKDGCVGGTAGRHDLERIVDELLEMVGADARRGLG